MPKIATPVRAKPQQMVMGFFVPAETVPMPGATPVRASRIPDIKQWFRVAEVAVIFGVSEERVRQWIDAGVLDARMIAVDPSQAERRHCRVVRESIVRLLADGSRSAI